MRKFLVAILLFAASSANAQQVAQAPKFIRENSPVIALTHVQLIDGTGAAAQADQAVEALTKEGSRPVQPGRVDDDQLGVIAPDDAPDNPPGRLRAAAGDRYLGADQRVH